MRTKPAASRRFLLPGLILFAASLPGYLGTAFASTFEQADSGLAVVGSGAPDVSGQIFDSTGDLIPPATRTSASSGAGAGSSSASSSGPGNSGILNPAQPTRDFDFGSLLYGPPAGNDQQTTLAVDSVGGNDANVGTLQSPKFTLPSSLANNATLGLFRGSRFRASLPSVSPGGSHGITMQDVARGSTEPLPVVSALDPIDTSGVNGLGDGVFSYLWTPADTGISSDGYANVYVVEINTATEAAQPVASRRRMTDVTSLDAVQATAGTAWVQPPGGGPDQSGSGTQWKAVFHASDGDLPGSGSYRYEVVSRVMPADLGAPANLGDGAMSGVHLVGGSSGYGSLGSPLQFTGDRLVVEHASTHNAVIGAGSLSRSVFYEGGDDDSIMLAWYTANPTGLSWSMTRCLFYAGTRPTDMVIAHSGDGGQNYARGDIADCAFVGAGRVGGVLYGVGFSFNNVTTGVIERSYVQGVRTLFGTAMPVSAEVRNNVFRQVQTCNVGENFHDNLVLAEPAGVNYATASPCSFSAAGASATNNLFWAHGITNGFPYNDGANGMNIQGANCTCSRNIFVLDPASTTARSSYFYHGSTDVATLAVDYNLVINLGKAGIDSQGNHFSWAEHRAAYPTIDVHSLYVDLSGDPRGLRAVFADPDHGDFRWAQTEVGQQCATYCAANNVGPSTVTTHWPIVPTVDAAVAAISLLPPKITGSDTVTFTSGAYGAYHIATDLDGTPDAPTNYGAAGQPNWLSMNTSSGVMSGVAPQTGNVGVSVSATNRAGTSSAALHISVQTAFIAWQNTYFTAAELNNPAISGPNATPARDGVSNLMKYALGLNPKADGTRFLPTVSLTTVGVSRFLTLTYNRSLAASDVTYAVEVSGDLQAWVYGATNTAIVSTTINAAGTMQTVVQRDLTPISTAKQRFIRLKIKQP